MVKGRPSSRRAGGPSHRGLPRPPGAVLLACAVLAQAGWARSQQPPDGRAPQAQAQATPNAGRHLAAATRVTIELAEEVSTTKKKRGDTFAIRLAEPIIVEGRTLVPAGALGGGEVVDAASGGIAGRPGKLILAARFLTVDGVRVPLRGFTLAGGGRDNGAAALALRVVPYVGIIALAIPGGNVVYPAGVQALAKIANDVDLPDPSATSSASADPPATTRQ